MSDLIISLIIVLLLSSAAFVVAVRCCRLASQPVLNLVALLTLATGGLYFLFVWDQAVLASLVPVSGLIVLGNWFPVFAGFLAGIVWCQRAGTMRRAIVTTFLAAVSVFALVAPMFGANPICSENWKGDICLQTTPYTCTPASAATLLRVHGIDATESEMAELCLTRKGTNWMGLFRGLLLKTQGSPWKVEVFDVPAEGTREGVDGPAILVARLPGDQSTSQLVDTSGWIPGQAHSVVLLGDLNDDLVIVGDPSFGRELWRRSELQLLWTGRGIRLVPRDPSESASLLASIQR